MWPYIDGLKIQEEMEKANKINSVYCGECPIKSFDSRVFADYAYVKLLNDPESYLHDDGHEFALKWILKYRDSMGDLS